MSAVAGAYQGKLRASYATTGSMLCLGLDPVADAIPAEFGEDPGTRVAAYCVEILDLVASIGAPGAIKPNIGFFHAIDRPRDDDYSGSRALARILDHIGATFPGVPVIMDAKRGDIARSSANYGIEAFTCWQVDAVTVAPYMGDDSVGAMLDCAREAGGACYVLGVTSNPGADRFQKLRLESGRALAHAVAGAIVEWHAESACCGAVVGATHPAERDELLDLFGRAGVPVLVPGVGSQGGTPEAVSAAISNSRHDRELIRVNVSSGITHPWRHAAPPADWRARVADAYRHFHRSLG